MLALEITENYSQAEKNQYSCLVIHRRPGGYGCISCLTLSKSARISDAV